MLRACSEAYADGADLEFKSLAKHPAVIRRVSEFWADLPDEAALSKVNLVGQPLLAIERTGPSQATDIDFSSLTAKENLLLGYMISQAGEICEKDDLVQAVWPEDVIYEKGVRDDSLAQLIRRLRVKIEPDPSEPKYIHTVPGRGYLFRT